MPHEQLLLGDARTSGGLLAAMPESAADGAIQALAAAGTLTAALIERIIEPGNGRISVTKDSLRLIAS
ncbi:MAG TPA: hypothetical protein VG826_10765 [Pirellulales bacterium]|nr:hypothetical protein [Pirellulales bacterium]